MARAMTIYCDKCGAEITLEPSQSICLGRSKNYDLCLKCYDSIAEKLADVEKWIFEEEKKETGFHCGAEESGWHAYNCNDCPNKCEEWYQWDKEFKK